MFRNRSEQVELMDDLSLDNAELEKNLSELVKFNALFGSVKVYINALHKVYLKYTTKFKNHKLIIADLGCGSGDLLHAASAWLLTKKIDVQLIGIDANLSMIRKAQMLFNQSAIRYQVMDIFSDEFAKLQFDIVSLNSITHHFNDISLIRILTQLMKQTRLAIIINDLHRHPISYIFVKNFVKLLKLSFLAQHDAPLSVLRAFKKQELINILNRCQVKSFQIQWKWPFRWQIIIWLEKNKESYGN